MRVLAIDVGGTHVKVLLSGEDTPRKFDSGPELTPSKMVKGVQKITKDWKYDAISMGYPGPVVRNRPVMDPYNLGEGWVGFHFEHAFGCPIKIVNDAAMQALGSYKKGRMLFLGLGTGLGTALVVDGVRRANGVRAPSLQKGNLRRLCGAARFAKEGKEEVAQAGGGCGRETEPCARAGRSCAGWRQRKEAQGIAATLPGGRQLQRISRGVPAVERRGRERHQTTEEATLTVISRTGRSPTMVATHQTHLKSPDRQAVDQAQSMGSAQSPSQENSEHPSEKTFR